MIFLILRKKEFLSEWIASWSKSFWINVASKTETIVWKRLCHLHTLGIYSERNRWRYHWCKQKIVMVPNETLGEHPMLLLKRLIDTYQLVLFEMYFFCSHWTISTNHHAHQQASSIWSISSNALLKSTWLLEIIFSNIKLV